MISTILFIVVIVLPLIAYFVNTFVASRESRGIAAGIPKPKQAKEPKEPKRRAREARVRQRRAIYCGRDFTHFALAMVGSQDACRYCTYLQEVPPPAPRGEDEDDGLDAAVRAAEEIIDQAKQ